MTEMCTQRRFDRWFLGFDNVWMKYSCHSVCYDWDRGMVGGGEWGGDHKFSFSVCDL